MPHLLVAGTTGSGKSVGLNAILLSLLYRFTPNECRLILIDPKMLELKSYDDIPHLLSPVVTEPHKSVRALKWAVEEMERRYRMMSDIGARNLGGFNERVSAAIAKGKPLGRRVQTGFDPDTGEDLSRKSSSTSQPLPQIVLIVDELADLMITVGKEIEVLIQRLSQKSRAAGIHLIMATQRPSVDVITGVIKANLPTRISFHVTSRIDSRTILGEQGAEQLLGKGDMLYKPSTARSCASTARSSATRKSSASPPTGAARARRPTSIRSPRSPRTTVRVRRRVHRERQPRGAQVPPGVPDRVREPEGARLVAPAPDGRRLQHRRQVDRADGGGRPRRPRPCRPARRLIDTTGEPI